MLAHRRSYEGINEGMLAQQGVVAGLGAPVDTVRGGRKCVSTR